MIQPGNATAENNKTTSMIATVVPANENISIEFDHFYKEKVLPLETDFSNYKTFQRFAVTVLLGLLAIAGFTIKSKLDSIANEITSFKKQKRRALKKLNVDALALIANLRRDLLELEVLGEKRSALMVRTIHQLVEHVQSQIEDGPILDALVSLGYHIDLYSPDSHVVVSAVKALKVQPDLHSSQTIQFLMGVRKIWADRAKHSHSPEDSTRILNVVDTIEDVIVLPAELQSQASLPSSDVLPPSQPMEVIGEDTSG